MNGHQCVVVVGTQWGDEGKGKIVDVLSAQADVVARYQGGANAGHTVDVAGAQFILRQIPSGILHEGTRCLLGNGVVFDILQFFEELDALVSRGVEVADRIGVSGRANLLLPYHKRLDAANEARLGEGKIGTTGRGIGPAYEDKIARRGIRLSDLRDAAQAGELIRAGTTRTNERLQALGAEALDPDAVASEVLAVRDRILPLITDTGAEITRALHENRRVLLEGAQGALLDVDHGTYPFVTSSNTTAGGAAIGVGIGPTAIDAVLGVVRRAGTVGAAQTLRADIVVEGSVRPAGDGVDRRAHSGGEALRAEALEEPGARLVVIEFKEGKLPEGQVWPPPSMVQSSTSPPAAQPCHATQVASPFW